MSSEPSLIDVYRRFRRVDWTHEDANEAYTDSLCGRTISAAGPVVWDTAGEADGSYHHVSCWISAFGEKVGLPFGELREARGKMEEWRFDLTNPKDQVGVIMTASSTTVALNVAAHTAAAIVEAHNNEWKRAGGTDDLPEDQLWVIMKHLGEGYTEIHSVVIGDRPMVEQWVRHLTNGVKVDLRLHPAQPKRVSIAEMEQVQQLFKEMRQHESDSQRYVGLANEARNRLKALGAPVA